MKNNGDEVELHKAPSEVFLNGCQATKCEHTEWETRHGVEAIIARLVVEAYHLQDEELQNDG
eukprot:607438-Amphidinium_carterae.1